MENKEGNPIIGAKSFILEGDKGRLKTIKFLVDTLSTLGCLNEVEQLMVKNEKNEVLLEQIFKRLEKLSKELTNKEINNEELEKKINVIISELTPKQVENKQRTNKRNNPKPNF